MKTTFAIVVTSAMIAGSAALGAGTRPLAVTVILDRSDSLSLGPRGVRAAAARFVTDLLPTDEARVCAFTSRIACSTGFTTDHEELAREVARLSTGFGSRLYDAVSETIDDMQHTAAGRRHVIVIFSDGEDNGSRMVLRKTVERARASGVMIYAIGLDTRFDDGDDMVPSRPDRWLRPLAAATGGSYYEADRSEDLMKIVARIEEDLRH